MIRTYVVEGATLKCSYGSQTSKLKIPHNRKIKISKIKQATVADYHANVNILPFGQCKSLKNPQVKAATQAHHGHLTPQPCQPVLLSPWNNEKGNIVNNGDANLLNTSTLRCKWSGVIEIEDDGQPHCTLRAAPPPVRYEKDPDALPEDKGDIEVDGKKYPIYVPEYRNGSNALYKNNGWTVVKTKHVSATNVDWLGVISSMAFESLDDPSGMSKKDIQNFYAVSFLMGFIKAVADNTVTTSIRVEIQQKGKEHRAVVQYGASNTMLKSKAGQTFDASSLNQGVDSDYEMNKMVARNFIKSCFGSTDDKAYDIKITFDSKHKKEYYIGYLSIVNNKIYLTPKLYSGDSAELGYYSLSIPLLGDFNWKHKMDLRCSMQKSSVVPKNNIDRINKLLASDIKFISS
jgi:hypothetical protein